VSESLTTTTR
ncbi:eamA-like transporter family protein, partial [Vibrio parahaemolyticus AQ3810]